MRIKLLYKNFFIIQAVDICILTVALFTANLIRLDLGADLASKFWIQIFQTYPWILLIKMAVFHWFDVYRGMWRYTGLVDLANIVKGSTTGSLFCICLILFVHRFDGFSRSVFLIDWFLTIFMITSFRLSLRSFYAFKGGSRTWKDVFNSICSIFDRTTDSKKRILIIGAGDCGEKICREIRTSKELAYEVVGFLDDHPVKVGKTIHGIPVLNSIDNLDVAAQKVQADQIIIAIPSATSIQMRRIIDICEESKISFKIMPNISEIIRGEKSIKFVRDVSYFDLLGRKTVNLDEQKICELLKGRRILVTGGGGSIGFELCRQIALFRPEKLVLFDQAETQLFEAEQELSRSFPDVQMTYVLGDIRDIHHLESVFVNYLPDVVFHAAAYKHVPILEKHPWKAVDNNVVGTMNVAECAKKNGVSRFVFVSTDKAVRPSNIMGASKRVAEIFIQNQNNSSDVPTKFMIVRFGNVVGSGGSVVPIFKKQIERGGPVTVTHPEMTRYFMTTSEACQLILQAGTMGNGGEIFILDMGAPVRIDSMARELVKLSGFKPDIDIKIEYIGLRPGEKLYEELITAEEGVCPTPHKKIMVLKGAERNIKIFAQGIGNLSRYADIQDISGIVSTFRSIVPEYKPSGFIVQKMKNIEHEGMKIAERMIAEG